jgi:hypothetical protein
MNGLADELRLALYDEILHLTGKLMPRPVDGRPVRLFRIDAHP